MASQRVTLGCQSTAETQLLLRALLTRRHRMPLNGLWCGVQLFLQTAGVKDLEHRAALQVQPRPYSRNPYAEPLLQLHAN